MSIFKKNNEELQGRQYVFHPKGSIKLEIKKEGAKNSMVIEEDNRKDVKTLTTQELGKGTPIQSRSAKKEIIVHKKNGETITLKSDE